MVIGRAPEEIVSRVEEYCADHQIETIRVIGYGIDAFVWQTSTESVLKVFRHEMQYRQELLVYDRLSERGIHRLQGFAIPSLLNYDDRSRVLELSFVHPTVLLDFAAATLDKAPPGFDSDDPDWNLGMQNRYGSDWPDVKRLLDALRQYGIHFTDVHLGNIRLRP